MPAAASNSAVKKLGVLINPTSGRGAGASEGGKALAAFAAAGVDVVDLSGSSWGVARANAQSAIDAGAIDGLVVLGGDGMMHLGVNLCVPSGLPLGIIAAGTGNDSARALGMPLGDASAGAQAIIARLAEPRSVDVIEATTDRGKFFAFGALSAGFDAIVNARATAMRFPKGPARYQWALYLELAKFKPISFRATVDGVERSFKAMLCTAANTPAYGGGMLITPEASITDGLLDLFIVHEISRPELIKVFPKVFTGEHVTHPAVEIIRASSVTLEAPGIPSAADGEMTGFAPMTAKVLPSALRVFA